VVDFIGWANFIPANVHAQQNGQLTLDMLGQTLTVDAAEYDYEDGAEVTVVVRPEMMVLNRSQSHVDGKVRRASYLGNVVEYDVEVGELLLALGENDPRHITIYPEGKTVQISFLEDYLYVLPH